MAEIIFDGQQTDEKILAVIGPHPMAEYVSIIGLVILLALFILVFIGITSFIPAIGFILRLAITIGGILVIVFAIWWTRLKHQRSVTYVTDRRILRFEATTPFYMAKRGLFWNEVLKAKGHTPNLFYRILRIGTVVVEPHLSENENIIIPHVYLYEDLANYIDKILFVFKNKPEEITDLKPWVAKPRGQRG